MTAFKRFEDSEIWKKARLLCNSIYTLSESPPFSRDFVLRDQIRRSAISVMANIAEGIERSGNAELVQFLAIAKGSCGEVRSLLYLASDRRYISDEKTAEVMTLCLDTSRMITSLIKYLRATEMKGFKFKEESASYHCRLEL